MQKRTLTIISEVSQIVAAIVTIITFIYYFIDKNQNTKATTNKMIEGGNNDFLVPILGIVFMAIFMCITIIIQRNIRKTTELLDSKLVALNIISELRAYRLFVKSFENIQFFIMPNETEQEFRAKLPEYGLYENWIKQEKIAFKQILVNEMKDLSIENIEDIIFDIYKENQN